VTLYVHASRLGVIIGIQVKDVYEPNNHMTQQKNIYPFNESIFQSSSSTEPTWENYIYAIPYERKFIVYQPLKRLAFIANQGMVDFITRFFNEPSDLAGYKQTEAFQFLNSIGFFDVPSVSFPPIDPIPKFKPTIAVLLLTTSCNFHCVYCYASSGSKPGDTMTLETGYSAIDNVCKNAIDCGESNFSLNFHGGGEPTVAWEDFCNLVKYARSRNLAAKISLSTNGYWNTQKLNWILSNIDEVSLSIDGIAGIQNQQRPLRSGGKTFKTVFDTIKALDKNKVAYGIRLTVTESSVDSLPESIEFFCKETGCTSFQAEPAFSHGRAKMDGISGPINSKFITAFLSAYDIAKKHKRNLSYSGARPLSLTNTFCQAPFNALVVSKEGQITTCYEVFDPLMELGNIFFIGNMTSDGGIKVDERRRHTLIDTMQERRNLCRGCFCYWHCAGDCPAKTLSTDDKGHMIFGNRCEVNRELTKEMLLRYIYESEGIWTGDSKQITTLSLSEDNSTII